MDHYEELIEREKRKIRLLQAKIKEAEDRMIVLGSLRADETLDAALGLDAPSAPISALPTTVAALAATAPPMSELFSAMTFRGGRDTVRRLPEKWLRLFAYIGPEGKTAEQLSVFLRTQQLDITEGAMRTGLMNYRKDYGLIENPRRGVYKLSEKGAAVVADQMQKNESLAAANSEA